MKVSMGAVSLVAAKLGVFGCFGYRNRIKWLAQAPLQWSICRKPVIPAKKPASEGVTRLTAPVSIAAALLTALFAATAAVAADPDYPADVQAALGRAGDNAGEIRQALEQAPDDQQNGMQFLVENMPDRDLQELTADFLLENVDLAYRAWRGGPWGESISEPLFLNDVLPYASVTEQRDNWRKDFRERFLPLVGEAKSPGEAAATLNNKIFEILGVRYSTSRRRPDQGPYESIESGVATCTGLSIILIDACRAVGVPARFAGTPLWADRSGNHSWVEVWDDGWHFTGAAEANGMKLDDAWFTARASLAKRDEPRHAIYAASFRKTPIHFPCVWARRAEYVPAVNVSDRYTANHQELPEGMARAMFRVVDGERGDRCSCRLRVESPDGKLLYKGQTNDERFDMNDHTTAVVPLGEPLVVKISNEDRSTVETITLEKGDQLFTFQVAKLAPDTAETEDAESADPIASLRDYLAQEPSARPPLEDQPFAQAALSREQSDEARQLLWDDRVKQIKASRAAEMQERVLHDGEFEMPFAYTIFGDKPKEGRTLYISMHGGGNAPARVNDSAWERHKTFYKLSEGVYVAPRAPTNTWNMWHQPHVDRLFARLIEDMIVFEDVDPNRVYLMGYSAGGDGVYQLAPRMADQLAAAAMMAGHPNEVSPLGLRNIGFAIHMGGDDSAYNRNQVAREWKEKLAKLHEEDPEGYRHLVEIYPGKGHWMERLDASAVEWVRDFVRDPIPDRIVWKQDNEAVHRRFYWLAVDEGNAKPDAKVVATLGDQEVEIVSSDVDQLIVRLDDRMVDLDAPVRVTHAGTALFDGKLQRRIATLAKTLHERGDPGCVFAAEVTITLAE